MSGPRPGALLRGVGELALAGLRPPLRALQRRVPPAGPPGLDPDVARVVRLLDGVPAHALPVPALRLAYEVQTRLWQRPDPLGVRVEERLLELPADATGPVRRMAVRTYTPAHPTGGALVFVHGGGWVIGSLDTHDPLCRRLAAGAGVVVHALDYRLAPEHPCPAGVTDVLQAWRLLHVEHVAAGGDPARLGVGGDSAGGMAGAVVATEAVEPTLGVDVPAPGYAWLVYPAVDTVWCASPEAAATLPTGVPLTGPLVAAFDRHHRPPGHDPATPALNPLHRDDAVLAAHCRTWLQTVAFDPLAAQGAAYADRLAALGVEVEHDHDPALAHEYVSMGAVSSAAAAALDRGVAALRRLVA